MSIERLQKILAQAGIASRRKAEEIIEQGLVTVNGQTAKLGDKADFSIDHIKVDGKLLRKLEDPFYVVMNKPKGVISMMSDPDGRPTLADFLVKLKVRVNPIGRLDFNSEGLLLLTNDGAIAEKIQKSDAFPRVYHVKIKGHITTEMIDRLNRGARLAHKFVKPLSVRIHDELNKKTLIEISFMNAANVDVKTYFEEKGFLVEKITRTSIGHLTLHGLEPGAYRTVPKTKFEALIVQPELGIKALTHRHEKEREILPRDQRMRNIDEHGKVIPKVTSEIRVGSRVAGKITAKGDADEGDTKGLKKGLGARASGKDDRIVVRATGDEATKAGPKKKYATSIDMPSFKRRSNVGAGRSSDSRGPDSRGPRPAGRPSAGAGKGRPAFAGRDGKPRFSPRSEGRSEGGFASRGPRTESREGGFKGGRSEGRSGARAGFAKSAGSFGSAPTSRPSSRLEGRPGRPITRVKRKER